MDLIQRNKEIKNKKIACFENHHYALLPWAELKRNNIKDEIMLISFDHHTDILEPFQYYSNSNEDIEKKLLKKIDYQDDQTIIDAIKYLRNDEHIKTALSADIISNTFIISHSNSFDFPESIEEKERIKKLQQCDLELIRAYFEGKEIITPREKRTYPKSNIYMPPFFTDNACEHGDEYDDKVLEDAFLIDKFEILSRMCPDTIGSDGTIYKKYILDIDLDYFHKMKALVPQSSKIFTKLVQKAEMITIAKESVCVEMVRTEDNITSDVIMNQLEKLLESILKE